MTERRGILVGYDGSEDAERALAWAADAALRRDQSVIVVVADESAGTRGGEVGVLSWWPESHYREVADLAVARLAEAGVGDGRVERHTGALVPTLVARAGVATMVVLGSRGRGRAGQVFVGSAGAGTAGLALCPVVVVREAPVADLVVVGVDGSATSRKALEFACVQAGLTDQKVLVVHAGSGPAEQVARLVAEAERAHPGVPLAHEVVDGSPTDALVEASRHSSLVVVGSRGLRLAETERLGSVSHALLLRAECPVAVVR
jgi:nucleotide-binding universal stress UspA family protein